MKTITLYETTNLLAMMSHRTSDPTKSVMKLSLKASIQLKKEGEGRRHNVDIPQGYLLWPLIPYSV